MSGVDVVNYVRLNLLDKKNNQNGYILLDHRWQSSVGDFDFDRTKFPNPLQFIKAVR